MRPCLKNKRIKVSVFAKEIPPVSIFFCPQQERERQADREPVSSPSTSALQLLQLLGKSSPSLRGGARGILRAATGGLAQPSSASWSSGGGAEGTRSQQPIIWQGHPGSLQDPQQPPFGSHSCLGTLGPVADGEAAPFSTCELEKAALRIILGIVRPELLQVQIREAIKSKTMHPARSGLGRHLTRGCSHGTGRSFQMR